MKNTKIKTWMAKPITRGDYCKMCGISLGLTTAWCLGLYAWAKHQGKKIEEDEELTNKEIEEWYAKLNADRDEAE